MSTQDTGGPAFPFTDSASPHEYPGMTLRDYFAAKMMHAFLASPLLHTYDMTLIAGDAYRAADAMLKARNQ